MTLQLVRQARLIDPGQALDQVGDVLVRDGQIEAIAEHLDPPHPHCEVIDAEGMFLGPGLVDIYSTSGEPGHESRETLSELLEAAKKGGFTRIHILPNTHPCLDHPGAIQQLFACIPEPQLVQLKVWGAITQNASGTQFSQLQDLKQIGIIGLSDGKALQDWVLIQRLLDYAQPLSVPIAIWPCLESLARDGVIQDGIRALKFGLPSLSIAAETTAIAMLLELLEQAQSPPPIHLMRISTARSVALIAAAKQRGLPISASTPWTHVVFNADLLSTYDPMLRLAPPLGNPEDQTALIDGLKSGVIDAIAIDHQAYTYEEKTVPFAQAPPRMSGICDRPALTLANTGESAPVVPATPLGQAQSRPLQMPQPS